MEFKSRAELVYGSFYEDRSNHSSCKIYYFKNDEHTFCDVTGMTNDVIRFTLDNNVEVIVRKITDNTYDFELVFAGGSRRTFVWTYGTPVDAGNKKSHKDEIMIEAINKFSALQK